MEQHNSELAFSFSPCGTVTEQSRFRTGQQTTVREDPTCGVMGGKHMGQIAEKHSVSCTQRVNQEPPLV